jgi:hypothetical protein
MIRLAAAGAERERQQKKDEQDSGGKKHEFRWTSIVRGNVSPLNPLFPLYSESPEAESSSGFFRPDALQ